MTENEIQQGCADLVRREVYCCASSLVYQLAQNYGVISSYDNRNNNNISALADTIEQAFELSYPTQDCEEAAIQAGYHVYEVPDDGFCWGKGSVDDEEIYDTRLEAWLICCEENNIDPYERDVFEHWIVSEWLGRKLTEHGEKVDFDFCNLTIWARTTTGQSISMDGVIVSIWKSLQTES